MQLRHLALGERRVPVQAIAQRENLGFPRLERAHRAGNQTELIVLLDALQRVVFAAEHVFPGQRAAVAVRLHRLLEGDLTGALFGGAEIHEDFVFDTAGDIRRQPDVFFGVKGRDAFDQADGADGDEVVCVRAGGIVLFDNMRNQTEVVLDQLFPRLPVAALHRPDAGRLLFGAERARKRAGRRGNTQNTEGCAAQQRRRDGKQHGNPPFHKEDGSAYAGRCCPVPG